MNSKLKRVMAQRRLETRSAPIPRDNDQYLWQRRFTWLVQAQLADPLSEEPITPQEAGEMAKTIVQKEWSQTFPGEPIPKFMQ